MQTHHYSTRYKNLAPCAQTPNVKHLPEKRKREGSNKIKGRAVKKRCTEKNDKINPLDVLPVEISVKIFSLLQPIGLARCCLVSKQWEVLANDASVWKAMGYPAIAFGARQWKDIFDVAVEEPPLPLDIHKILNSQCPFSKKGIKVEDTHVLVLIPGSINGMPLTLKSLGKLMYSKFPEFDDSGYQHACRGINLENYENTSGPYWVLMTKGIALDSELLRYCDQQRIIKMFKILGQQKYQVPHVIEAAVCIFMEYARSNINLLNGIPFTRCQEKFKRGYQIVIGYINAKGLNICHENNWFHNDVGVAAVWRL